MMFSDYVRDLELEMNNTVVEFAKGLIEESNTYGNALIELKQQRMFIATPISKILYDKTAEYIRKQALKQSTK